MYIKANFTVEAAILVPLITVLLVGSVGWTVRLHEQTIEVAEKGGQIKLIHPVKQLHEYQTAEVMVETILGK